MTERLADQLASQDEFDPFAGPAILATAPTTEPQREVWMASQMGVDGSLAYNESVTVWMKGPLDVDALQASLRDVVERHEALRSTFSADGLTLVVSAGVELPVFTHDAAQLAQDEREAAWEALLVREVTEPFNLVRGPLARAAVFRVGPDEHRVVFTAHHIVCDGWSTAVILREWASSYSARVGSGAPGLPPADSFSAYARAETTPERVRVAADNETYWVARFADAIPAFDLPADRPRPPRKTYPSLRVDHVLEEGLVRDLRKLGSGERASLFATLLAGFQALLSRLSGQSDLVIGVPAAGQSVGGHEGLVGHCVNILPLRTQVDPGATFRALLGSVRGSVLEAYDHQEYTFSSLLKRLPLARDPSRLPLVSVVFNVDRGLKDDELRFGTLSTRVTTNPRRFENFDVFVNAVELQGRVTLECQYNTDLFDRATVERWLASYERLLRGVVDDPLCVVGRLPVVTDAEQALIAKWNASTAREVARDLCAHELVEAQATLTPDAVAVEDGVGRLTYAELDAMANRIARKLRAMGVRRGSLVGLCLERSRDMVVALFGILKSGGAYVPVDPGFPKERIAFMLEDAQCGVLVTQSKLRGELPGGATLLDLDEARAELASMSGDALERVAGPDDRAYVIYTSGSTGKPKGVELPHRAVVNFLSSMAKEPGLTAEDVLVAVTTLSFDIAVLELYLPLTLGAKVVVATREDASDGAALQSLLQRTNATAMQATPATWRLLLEADWKAPSRFKALCGGEALPLELARTLTEQASEVWNMYGPTETCVWSTCERLVAPVDEVLIGRPIANTTVHVLDGAMQAVPIGVHGELYIGGRGVALGYLKRPELTRERFIQGMYRTGDVVRLRADGRLQYVGRNDNQVKVRGYRIELGEIESRLGEQAAVREACVVVKEFSHGDARLVAYLATKAGAQATQTELRQHLRATLPEYMVPQHFVLVDAIPRLPNGKIDRNSLPSPMPDEARDGFVEPRTSTEKMLAKLWQDVLGVGRIGIRDDFFALGGHSLLASQAIARLRRDHGVEVSFRKMFETPTIEKLAATIEATPSGASLRPAELPPRGSSGPAPLSIAQSRLWLLEEMDPAQRLVHNLCASWRLTGALDVVAMQRTIDEIVRRHEILRTGFESRGGEPVQVPHAERAIGVRVVDLTSLAERDRAAALSAGRDAEAAVPFDLARDPLLRVTLFRLAPDCHVLSTVQHNIVWDGWSFDVFLNEVSALYPAFARGEPSPLPALPLTYADFASYQKGWIDGPDFERQAAFWRAQLAGAERPLELPTDRPRKGTRSHEGGSDGTHISGERVGALTALAHARGATLFMLVFAAYGVLMHRYTGQREFLVGVPTRARSRPELEQLIGPFVNTVPVRMRVDPAMTFAELLDQVREATLDAFEHQEAPMDTLGVRAPMLRALFSLQDARARPVRIGDLDLAQEHAVAPVAASELMLWAMESRADLLLMFNYATDLFEARTVRRMLDAMDAVLAGVEKDPTQQIRTMPVLGVEERQAITGAAGALSTGGRPDLFSLVARWAERRPQDIAIEHEGARLSYGQLVTHVRGVAETWADRMTTGTHVAVHVSRADDRIVAILAVLSAGATLSLDGDQASVVLTELPASAGDCKASRTLADSAVAYRDHCAEPRQGSLALVLEDLAEATGLQAQDVVAVGVDLRGASALCAQLLPLVAGARLTFQPSEEAGAHTAPTVLIVPAAASQPRRDPEVAKTIVIGVTSPGLWSSLRDARRPAFGVHMSVELGQPISVCVAGADPRPMLGRPLRGVRFRVVDGEGEDAPIAAGGALLVDVGDGEVPTGQRVRLSADRTFEHVGRTDGKVQLDDRLVDPVAIARALEQHPAVREAWVSIREDRAGQPRLVGYWASRRDVTYTETELRDCVRNTLGGGLVPRVLVELDALPRDASGTVDEERLASPYEADVTQEYVAPRTEEERYVASAWQQALGVARIGLHDNFFDLGGHSLLCFRFIARVEKETGKRISPRVVLLNTLQQVAAELESTRTDVSATTAPSASEQTRPVGARERGIRSWIKNLVKR
jgi:amino acid adenylation domain-containing protein